MKFMQYGDTIRFESQSYDKISNIIDVAPIKFDAIKEQWVVCAQKDATHMLIIIDAEIDEQHKLHETKYLMIEIGKCENLFLLADAIVD